MGKPVASCFPASSTSTKRVNPPAGTHTSFHAMALRNCTCATSAGGSAGAALATRAPRASRSELRVGRDADAWSESVSERDALHFASVFVVGDVEGHGGGVDVAEIVETVRCVSLPGATSRRSRSPAAQRRSPRTSSQSPLSCASVRLARARGRSPRARRRCRGIARGWRQRRRRGGAGRRSWWRRRGRRGERARTSWDQGRRGRRRGARGGGGGRGARREGHEHGSAAAKRSVAATGRPRRRRPRAEGASRRRDAPWSGTRPRDTAAGRGGGRRGCGTTAASTSGSSDDPGDERGRQSEVKCAREGGGCGGGTSRAKRVDIGRAKSKTDILNYFQPMCNANVSVVCNLSSVSSLRVCFLPPSHVARLV